MNVISLKDYAKKNNISYEAVRQQVVRYKEELDEHIIRDGRQQFLDEEAVAFLDAKRQKNPVAIIQMDKDEQIESLQRELDKAKNLIIDLQEERNKLKDEKYALEQETEKIARLEADNEAQKVKIAEVEKKASEDVQKVKQEAEEEKKRHEDEEYLLKQRAEAAEKRVQELENRTFGDYLKGLFRKK